MRSHRSVRAFVLGIALLAGATSIPIPAQAGPFQELRAAHERHKRHVRAAHQRHVRAVQNAHARHVRHAPRPVREVDRVVSRRHQAHVRHVERAKQSVRGRHAAHLRQAQRAARGLRNEAPEPVRFVESRHAAHRETVGSVGASAERAHRRHGGMLQSFADWLVGA